MLLGPETLLRLVARICRFGGAKSHKTKKNTQLTWTPDAQAIFFLPALQTDPVTWVPRHLSDTHIF